MPIATLDTPGSKLGRTLINTIITTLNAIVAAVNGGGALTQTTWVKVVPSSGTILGQGANIDSVSTGGNYITVNFTEPFADADDYAAVCTCSEIPGRTTGVVQISSQTTSSVTFNFVVDDGGTGLPARANVIIVWNRTA